MKNKLGIIFFVIAIVFIINAILGRYIVLPGYLTKLSAEVSSTGLPDDVPAWKIFRYLLWAFSFKLGVYFFILSIFFIKGGTRIEKSIFSIVGILYISIAYMDWSNYSSMYFGIGGSLITITSLCSLWLMGNDNDKPIKLKRLYEYLGFYFLIMASYNLCPLLGVRTFALSPEKMIAYNLQNDAVSFANHILSELTVGFSFILLSKMRSRIN